MKNLIAKYLPKAKTGKRRTALVVPRSGSASRSYIKLASKIRLPKAKAVAAPQSVAMASLAPSLPAVQSKTAQPAPVDLVALPRENPVKPEIDLTTDRTATASITTKPRPRVTTAALAIPPLPRAANDPIGDLSTHRQTTTTLTVTKPTPPGWQIQLGAAPSLAAANKILTKARAKNKRLLVARLNHTETVEKNNQTLYRARFVGFQNKSQARKACAILKKQKFACLALNP